MSGVRRDKESVGRLHLQYRLLGVAILAESIMYFQRRQRDGVHGVGVGVGEVREGRANHIEAVAVGTVVGSREVEDAKLVVSHIQHNAARGDVVHIARRVDASKLSANRHGAEQIGASRVYALKLAHGVRVHHTYGLLVAVVLRLGRVATGVGNVQSAVVVGNALRLVAHVAGVHHLLGLDVYLSHVALVGIRCNVQIALVVGGKSAVVGYILGCGNSGAVGADILYDVRPVYADGYQCVVHLQNVVAGVAEMSSGVLLLKPSACQHPMVEQRKRRVVHTPQTLA